MVRLTTTRLRATGAVLLLLLPASAILAFSPSAAAGLGDTLKVGAAVISPGNPCNAQGPSGGIAVRESGTSSTLYYATRNQTRIHTTNAYMPTSSSPPCTGGFNPAVSGTDGWEALAYDAFHPSVRLWAARNNSATIHGMTLAGAVLVTINVPGVTRVTGLAVDEAAPFHLYVSTGSTDVLRFNTVGTPTLQSTTSYSYGVSRLAAWGGALLTGDALDWVRNHRTDGAWLGMLFHPGEPYVNSWWQLSRALHGFEDMAFDEQTYASAGKGALWTVTTNSIPYCVANCPEYECVAWEGSTCIDWRCVVNCSGGAVYVYVHTPFIRAYEVVRSCPGGATVPPTQDCPCPAPVPTPVFTSPTNAVYHRGVPAGPYAMPVIVQGSAVVTAQGSSPDHVISIRGPLPSGPIATGYGSASSAPLVASAVPTGAYTYEATLVDAVLGCRGGTAQLTVWVEDPSLVSSAHALRIGGNIPANVLAGSIRAQPLDDLFGHERADVVDRRASGDVEYDLRGLSAEAKHGPDAWDPLQMRGEADAGILEGSVTIDLASLCFDTTGQPACFTLPWIGLDANELHAYARANLGLIYNGGGTWSGTSGHGFRVYEDGVPTSAFFEADGCLATAAVGARARQHGAAPNAATGLGCGYDVGGFRVRFAEAWQTYSPWLTEAYAAALRIEIDEGPYRGEIVVAEAHAGVSLIGDDAFAGPTRFLEADDDFGMGGDAPALGGPALPDGAFSGQMRESDRVDSFQAVASIGEKLRVVVDPAHRASAYLSPAPTAPTPHAAARQLNVTLLDPMGVARDRSTLDALDAHPAVVELNVDVTGAWTIVIERLDTRDEAAPYAVQVQRAPIDPPMDVGPDAPAGCAGAPTLGGPTTASVSVGDDVDTYKLTVGANEAVTAGLKLAEAGDGADLDLRVLDASCAIVAQSALGKGTRPKSEPDAVALVALPPGAAYVQVVRANGVGNYLLEAASHRRIS